jgi:hypothetical protein
MADNRPVQIIHDLDLIQSEKIGVKFKGKTYVIEDLKVGQGMKISLAYSKVVDLELKLANGQQVERTELAQAYYDIISIVIDNITVSDILDMTQDAINALLSLISRKLTGDPSLTEEISKKKLLNQPIEARLKSSFFRKLFSFVSSLSGPTTKS